MIISNFIGILRAQGWPQSRRFQGLRTAGIWLVVLPAAGLAMGAGAPGTGSFSAILAAAPCAEMPARAADLVLRADGARMAQTTVDVVKAAVGMNPAAVLAIVGSVAESVPSMAASAAGTAASLEPHLAVAIARAAAASAPGEAGPIVAALSRAVPDEYQALALAVVREAPGADRDVLAGVAAALPELKTKIDEELSGLSGKVVLASTVLAEVAASQRATQMHLPGDLTHRESAITLPGLDGVAGANDSSGLDGIDRPQNYAEP